MLSPTLESYVIDRQSEFAEIPRERQQALSELAAFVGERRQRGEPVRLTFICTHNSRRSHLSQIWAHTAAVIYGISGVECFSGGTEETAFNPRAVEALRRAGFEIPTPAAADNPRYLVRTHAGDKPLECFSKVYDHPPNPTSEYGAVMTCSHADENCPVVRGALRRFAIQYEDPKAFDGTAEESERYDERCRQIAREMLFAFSQLAS